MSETVSGSINIPSGYSLFGSELEVSYGDGFDKAMQISTQFGEVFNYIVAAELSSNLKFSVRAFAKASIDEVSMYRLIVHPGTGGNNINLEKASTLISPENNSSNIDSNTNFVYGSETVNGVYLIQIHSATGKFTNIITESTSVTLPDFLPLGINMFEFSGSWRVVKYNTSLDNFVSMYSGNNPNITSKTTSEYRNFKMTE